MTVWIVAPGADYEGESVHAARCFHKEADARAYAEAIDNSSLLGVDYVVVREVEVN